MENRPSVDVSVDISALTRGARDRGRTALESARRGGSRSFGGGFNRSGRPAADSTPASPDAAPGSSPVGPDAGHDPSPAPRPPEPALVSTGRRFRTTAEFMRDEGIDPSLRRSFTERMGDSLAEIKSGKIGKFGAGLINSTLKNPTFWYSTLTAATIAGARTIATQMVGTEGGEATALMIGAGLTAAKEGVTEAFKSRDKGKIVGAVLSGAAIGVMTSEWGYRSAGGFGLEDLAAEAIKVGGTSVLAAFSNYAKEIGKAAFSRDVSRVFSSKTAKEAVISGIFAGAFTGLADSLLGSPKGMSAEPASPAAPPTETSTVTLIPTRTPETIVAPPTETSTSVPVSTTPTLAEIPTAEPTFAPTLTHTPTAEPTQAPIIVPTETHTPSPTVTATATSTETPTFSPIPPPPTETLVSVTSTPTVTPEVLTPTPTDIPTVTPTHTPTVVSPTETPTGAGTAFPSITPTVEAGSSPGTTALPAASPTSEIPQAPAAGLPPPSDTGASGPPASEAQPPAVGESPPPAGGAPDSPAAIEQAVSNFDKEMPIPQGATPWAVAEQLLKTANPDGEFTPAQIMEVDKVLCEANDIAVPEWGIEGKILATRLPAGMNLQITEEVRQAVIAAASK